jgi:hypothetical protein
VAISKRRADCAPPLIADVRLHMKSAGLHPNQFHVNEAWIAFQLNEAPIETEQDGSLNCIALMDAASCFILGTTLIPTKEPEPSVFELKRLISTSSEHKNELPAKILVPEGQFQKILPTEAKRRGIAVVPVKESELEVFIGEARQGFREHVQRMR